MAFTPDLVSVIVLTFNSERYISRCLDALEVQSYRNFEVVVVDAGSKDRTREITDSYVLRLSIVWVDAPGTNMGQARNVGIRKARGEFLAYCDSDDLFEPEKLKAGVCALSSDHYADVAYGAAAHFRTEEPQRQFLSRRQVTDDGSLAVHFVRAQTININTLLVRRSEGQEVYFPDDDGGKYGEDWQYIVNLCLAGARFKFVPGVFSLIEVRSDSHTTWNIQYKMKWYVTRHLARHRDALVAAGCPSSVFAFHMSKHWLKFLVACNAAGRPEMPKLLSFGETGSTPIVIRFYNYFLLSPARIIVSQRLLQHLWTFNRRLKERRIEERSHS